MPDIQATLGFVEALHVVPAAAQAYGWPGPWATPLDVGEEQHQA